ncbi:Peptidyl-prolyl cis-trans isomerase FKBP62, partial [Bienertia sinuspersici]
DCEKIKKELRGLLIEKDNFDPEDIGCLFSYIDDCFREIWVCKNLSCLALETEEVRETFINITCVVLFSMATCFLRKKEFILAGKFCPIVLDLHPTSVKALFRKASAAMELGRLEFAVLDLELAYVIDPSNQEVCKKLGEAKVRFLKEMEDLSTNPKVDMRDTMLKVEQPLRVGTVLNPTQFKVGGDTMTKLTSVEEEKVKEETHEMIEDVILKEVENPKEERKLRSQRKWR